ncbi:hypothetical protein C9374_012631 [Naegleria lovaniensis]|uniref:Uncharacterized protein n=1 Tax=Naegleria lovaniensis TaxID=51637 RepID=A0AA88KR54_NAELO|nr:uncharacterized protein C9374_012631 [Naegleria lovaniensis]KAG2392379.1 hypothetical protein C9374_012631 [Naegleria lovaniensis]
MMKYVWQFLLCNRNDDSSDEEELKSSSSESASTQSHSKETAPLNGESHKEEVLLSSSVPQQHTRSNSSESTTIMANRFNMIESLQSSDNNADESILQSELTKLGDTIQLIGSDIARLISHMKMDGIQIINNSEAIPTTATDRDLLIEGAVRFFEQVFHTFDLSDPFDSRRHLLTSLTNSSETTEPLSNSEILKKGIVLLLEDLCRLCLTDKYLRKFQNALKFLSCLTQESISSFVIQLKSKLKVAYRGRARIFDGRMWVIEVNFNHNNSDNNSSSSPSLEIIHRRAERLCQSDSRTKDLLNTIQTPRAAGSSIEEVCKFVWSITFSFSMTNSSNEELSLQNSTQPLVLDSPVSVDFEKVEQCNAPSVFLFLHANHSEEELPQEQPPEEELNSQLVSNLREFFKNSFPRMM